MHTSRFLSPFFLLLMIAGILLGSGCATPETRQIVDPGTTDMRVESIDFRGVENVSESELLDGLALREDPGFRARFPRVPLLGAPPAYYNEFHWRRDRERIISFYHQRGYFDARIVSESIIEDPAEGTVRIRVTIDEGEPSRINRLEIQGLTPESPSRSQLLRGLPLREGQIFTEQNYRTTRNALGDRLRNAGHAYASVSGRVFIDPESHSADVYFFTDPGPMARLGPVYIFGLEDVSEDRVRAAIPFQQGDRYSPVRLAEAQTDLYDLGVFGLVTVLPAHEAREFTLEDPRDRAVLEEVLEEFDVPDDPDPDVDPGPDLLLPPEADEDSVLGVSRILSGAQRRAESRSRLDPEVPVVIRLQEAKKYSLRLGVGVAAESTRQDARALANWSARNFLGGLRRLDHNNAVGYAFAPTIISDDPNRGVILSSILNFQQPQFIDRRTNLRLRASIERDVQEGFSVWNPRFRISLDRPIFRNLVFDFSYNVAYFRYFNPTDSLIDQEATELGLDFREEFILEYFEQTLALDYRNDVLDPTRGFMVSLAIQEAGSYLFGGAFDFYKPILSAEYYQPFTLFTPGVLALRSRLGAAYNIGRDTLPGVPIQNRLYSGGTDGMRSFGRRRISLYTPTGAAVPVGGLTQFEASVEPRFRLVRDLLGIGDFWGGVFVDAATVLGEQFLLDTAANDRGTAGFPEIADTLLYGAGLGFWWNTPVGPVRLDGAYTLSNIEEDFRFRRCQDPSTYATAECVFVPVEDDPIQDFILGYGIYISIGHSF